MNQRHHLKTFPLRAALTLLVMMLTTMAWAGEPVKYIDENGHEQEVTDYTVLTSTMTALTTPGWYVVNSTVNYTTATSPGAVQLGDGEYHIILADGGKMNIGSSESPMNSGRGLFGTAATLTIYGQANGTGELNVYTSGENGDAIFASDLTINGGKITAAASGEDASGLKAYNNVTINGGVVNATATGNGECLGIKAIERVIFNGGQLTATGSNKGICSQYGDLGAISLSWKNTTDFIETNSYWLIGNSSLTIAAGKTFTDGNGNNYNETNAAEVLALTNTRLSPAQAFSVTFDSNGGSDVPTQFVASGGTVTEPQNPTKAGKVFCGWYLDSSFQTPYDFSSAVTGYLTLYAKWADAISTNISDATIQRIYRYTGSAVTPVVRNSAAQLLTAGTDYTVTGADNMTAPGVYTLTVTGIGSYTGSQTVNVRVLTFEKYDGTALVSATLPENNHNAIIVAGTTTSMSGGSWYVVSEDVTVADRISVSGDVNLVLCDGATLTAEKGISVTDGHSLTIYSQSGNTGTLVATIPDNQTDQFCAAIGGECYLITELTKAGDITIHGGVINALARLAAGIGTAYDAKKSDAGDITIYGGKIIADGNLGIGGVNATIHLGWCRVADDFIEARRYQGDVIFDKSFVLDGTVIGATTENIAGRKIVPTSGTIYTVTFESNGGSTVASQPILGGNPITEPGKPFKTHRQFAGWFTDEGCTASYDFSSAVNSNFTLYAKWVDVAPISYIDTDGQTVSNFTDYTPLEDNYTELPEGTYFVGKNTTVGSRIYFNGTVNLILGDGTTLTAEEGIGVSKYNRLNILQQSEGTGALTANAGYGNAAIGGSDSDKRRGIYQSGTICIYGGVITATGGIHAAAIGGTLEINNGAIYIYGGSVTAYAGDYAAAIGGFLSRNGGTISILGGKITARRHIHGFTGIGGENATIHLGWRDADDYIQSDGYQGTVIFDKSFVLESNDAIEANASNCGGQKLVPNTVPFYDVCFNTNGGNTIASQRIKENHIAVLPDNPAKQYNTFDGWYADANFSGSPYDFTTAVTGNFTLYAKWRPMYAVSFDKNASDATGAMGAQTLYVGEAQNLTVCTFSRKGYTFDGWATTAGGDVEYADGASVTDLATTAGANVTLYAHWVAIPYTITTPANFEVTVGGNAATTATIGQTVKLKAAIGHSIAGAPTVNCVNGTICAVSDAGDGSYTFIMPAGNVSVVALTVEQGWSFVGTYDTQNFTADDTNIYGFVGTAGTGTNVGTFVRVGGYVRVKPLRAYLQAPSQAQQAPALSTANSETPSTLRVRLLNSNGELTAIENLEFRIENSDGAWYALDGRKLQGKPTQKGLYINNGRKVAIK